MSSAAWWAKQGKNKQGNSKYGHKWNRKLMAKHSEIVLAFAICEQLGRDILSAWKRMNEYPIGSTAWYEWREAVILNIDESLNMPVVYYAEMCGFSFKYWLQKSTKECEYGVFDYDEWCKY